MALRQTWVAEGPFYPGTFTGQKRKNTSGGKKKKTRKHASGRKRTIQDVFGYYLKKENERLHPNGNVDYLRHQIADIIRKTARQQKNLSKDERKAIPELRKDKEITITPQRESHSYHGYSRIQTASRQDTQRPHNLQTSQERPYCQTRETAKENSEDPPYQPRNRSSVYYNTAQHLSRILAPLGKTGSSFVKDSASLVQQLRNISDTKKLVSYDVADLFTNIPIKEAIHTLSTRLETCLRDLDTKLTAQSIVDLVSKCFETSYFNWNGQLYQQIHGLPMGFPLSPLLTEIYMIDFEEIALKIAPFTPNLWFRKVDDVLVLLDDNQDPEALLQHLNCQHPRIHFTMEEETHQQLPFLDILLHRRQQSIATSVYRKPTPVQPSPPDQERHRSYPGTKSKSGLQAIQTKH
ncbi:uncharacterized protein [Haliotis asinina]|uniref:uncharacterized protein n=1 Tax=Haliotis asinina TaxID=109174 RepID=UPI0035326927